MHSAAKLHQAAQLAAVAQPSPPAASALSTSGLASPGSGYPASPSGSSSDTQFPGLARQAMKAQPAPASLTPVPAVAAPLVPVPAAAPLSPVSSGPAGLPKIDTNWNEEFQKLVDADTSTPEQRLAQASNMRRLVRAFSSAACAVVKVIVSETATPMERKQVKAVNVGGVAGARACLLVLIHALHDCRWREVPTWRDFLQVCCRLHWPVRRFVVYEV